MTAQHRSWEDSAVQNAYPDYYPLFHCIADRCRHNCCIGWEIDVDGDSLAAYDQIGGVQSASPVMMRSRISNRRSRARRLASSIDLGNLVIWA